MNFKKKLLAIAVASAFASSAFSQNLGFEDGNTTGWTSTTLSAVGTTTTQAGSNTWVINPYGSYMGQLQIQSGSYNSMATALGLTSSSTTAIQTMLNTQAQTSGGSPNPTTAGWVTKEVTLTAGTTFTLAWQYISVDYVPFNDGSIATLTQNGTNVATVNNYQQQYALLGFTNPGTGDYSTGSYGATGWQVATFQVSVDGTYTLGFGVFNMGDTALSPILYIDEVQGTTTKNGQTFGAVVPNNPTAPVAPSAPPPTPPAPTTVSSVASGTTVDTSNLASAVTVNGGTIQIATNNVTLTNTFTTGANSMTVDQNGNTSTFNGVIGGSGGVTIANSGTGGGVTFAAVNTYTGPTTVNSGASLTNTGTIAGTVTNLGTLTNSGTTGNVTNGFNGDGNTASLVNSGTTGNVLNFSSFANSGTVGNVQNFSTFTNIGNTGTFQNAGVLNNNAGGTINELGYNNFWVVNNGTINTVSYNGGTVFNHNTIGTINNQEAHGSFNNYGTVTGNVTTPSTFNNNTGGSVLGNYINDGTLNNAGTLTTVTNNSTFNNNAGGVATGLITNGGMLNNSGTLSTVNNNSTFNNNAGGTVGNVNNNGTFNFNGGTVGNVNNTGTLDISNNIENSEEILGITLYYATVPNIAGSGNIILGDKYLSITNGNNNTYSGVISGEGGVAIESGVQTLSANNTYTGVTIIGEQAILNNTGTLIGDVWNTGVFNNSGTIGGIANTGVTNNTGTTGDVINTGTFNNSQTTGTVINTDTGIFNNSGTTGNVINAGTFNLTAGSVNGIINSGTLDVSSLDSSTSYLGTYTQTSSGKTIINGQQHYTMNGVANLDGNLTINNSPAEYGRYTVFSAGTRNGEFNSLTSNGVNDYLKYSGNDVKLYVTPSAQATQSSINNVAGNLGNAMNLQASTVQNGLGNDCNLFGATGSCVSINLSQTASAGGDLQSGGVTLGKRINDNWRFGVFTNSPFNSTSVGEIGVKSNTAYGGYVGWNKNVDGKGLGVTASVAQGNGSMKILRNGPEAGAGTSNTDTKAYQLRANYAIPVLETVTVTPYVGVRRTETTASGYTEQGPVFPLTVNATSQSSTDIIAGASVNKQLTDRLSANLSAGVIQRISQTNAAFAGSSEIGNMSTFSGAVPTNGKTNPAISAGVNYSVDKTTRVGVSAGIQQNGSNANINTVGISLTKGF